MWYAPVRPLRLPLQDVWGARRSDQQIILLRDYLLHLRCQVLKLGTLHDFQVRKFPKSRKWRLLNSFSEFSTVSLKYFLGHISLNIKNVFKYITLLTFPGTISQWKSGTCTWSRNRLRLSPSTSTFARNSAASMKTTASLTSLRYTWLLPMFNTDVFLINSLTVFVVLIHVGTHFTKSPQSKFLLVNMMHKSCCSAAGMELTRRSWLAATTTSSGWF